MRNFGHTIIEESLNTEEYNEFNDKLQRLNADQLRELMTLANIEFKKTDNWEVDDFIGVLDEAYWDEFNEAFEKVTGKSFYNF